MSCKCAKCGIESEIEEAFLPSQKSYSSDKIFYCPACQNKNETQHGESYLIASVIVLIGGLVWLMASPQNELALLIFQSGLCVCFTPITAVSHELGHTLAGLMTKAKIFGVTIGLGRTLYNRNFGGIEWKFCAIPICGFVSIGYNNRKFYRMRSFLMTLSGPMTNCLLILAAVILLFHISSPRLSAVIKPFIIANIFSLLLGLWPRKVNFTGRSTPSDGLTLLMTPFMSKLKIEQEIESCYVWEGYNYFRRNHFEDAKRIYEMGLALFPNSTAIQNEMGEVLLYQGNYIDARNLFVQLQKSTNQDSVMSINILNSIATADVMIGGNDLLEEADAFSKTACEKMPWQTESKWVRGLVLVKKGNIEQGLTLLKEVTDKMENSSTKATYVSYIAEVENKKGE
jgi:hypothetical protein